MAGENVRLPAAPRGCDNRGMGPFPRVRTLSHRSRAAFTVAAQLLLCACFGCASSSPRPPRSTAQSAAAPEAPGAAHGAATKRLAVLEFSGARLADEVLNAFGDAARGGAVEGLSRHDIQVMTRENMLVLLRDMGKSECVEGDCEVETARNIGADYVMSGVVARIDDAFVVTLKLHECEGGVLLGTEQVAAARQLDVLNRLRGQARKLVAATIGADPTAPSQLLNRLGEQARKLVAGAIGTDSTAPSQPTGVPESRRAHGRAFSIRSSCRDEVRVSDTAFTVSGGWCFYLVEPAPTTAQQSVTFRARLLSGRGYGLWFGGRWNDGHVRATGIQYDAGAGGIKFLQYPETEAGFLPVLSTATDRDWHNWRIERRDGWDSVWLDGTRIFHRGSDIENREFGFRTWDTAADIADLTVSP